MKGAQSNPACVPFSSLHRMTTWNHLTETRTCGSLWFFVCAFFQCVGNQAHRNTNLWVIFFFQCAHTQAHRNQTCGLIFFFFLSLQVKWAHRNQPFFLFLFNAQVNELAETKLVGCYSQCAGKQVFFPRCTVHKLTDMQTWGVFFWGGGFNAQVKQAHGNWICGLLFLMHR